MWTTLLDRMARRLIRHGQLTITFPDGTPRVYGAGQPQAAFHVRTDAALRALCLQPELAMGEGYMDGTIDIGGNAELEALLTLVLRNRRPDAFPPYIRALDRLRFHARAWVQRNTAQKARANVAHHYDISDDLYRLMLDKDMQYSCAYFTDPAMTLEEAQIAKKNHIARKLRIEPGMRVLDIGCGWGGMAITLARDYGARVTGVTLSENQLATARARAAQAGLADRIEFRLMDYRELDARFDRIVSVGMLEHVGLPHYAEYFAKVSELLDPDGIALIHTIGHQGPAQETSQWIRKFIFPGAYIPNLTSLVQPIDNANLWIADVESLRVHYSLTLQDWRMRFESSVSAADFSMDDAKFRRMWLFYLISMQLAFRYGRLLVYQVQIAKKIQAAPLTRDYLYRPALTDVAASQPAI